MSVKERLLIFGKLLHDRCLTSGGLALLGTFLARCRARGDRLGWRDDDSPLLDLVGEVRLDRVEAPSNATLDVLEEVLVFKLAKESDERPLGNVGRRGRWMGEDGWLMLEREHDEMKAELDDGLLRLASLAVHRRPFFVRESMERNEVPEGKEHDLGEDGRLEGVGKSAVGAAGGDLDRLRKMEVVVGSVPGFGPPLLEDGLNLLLLVPREVVKEGIDLGEAVLLELVRPKVAGRLARLERRDVLNDRGEL
jgi:hypothetical protein